MENHPWRRWCSLSKYQKKNNRHKYFPEIFPKFSDKSFFKLPANSCLYTRNYDHEICLELSLDIHINLQKKNKKKTKKNNTFAIYNIA